MRVVIQRVAWARVLLPQAEGLRGEDRPCAEGCPAGKGGGRCERVHASIGPGLVALVGCQVGDGADTIRWMADRIARLRIFPDAHGRMNLALVDQSPGRVLLVPNFTVACVAERGRRPGFERAMPPEEARAAFERLAEWLAQDGLEVHTGRFGAHMHVELCNDGPVTFVLERAGNGPAADAR